MSRLIKAWAAALIAGAMAASFSTVLHARDRGINQPGAAGNIHRDPGVNQLGAAGNVGAPAVGKDRGIKQQLAKARGIAGFATFIQVTNTPGFIGHSYFVADPAVSADLVALVRYGLAPGDPGRPLEEISRPFWKIAPPRADTN